MPNTNHPVTLPQPALNHLPDQAASHLPPHLQPPTPNVIWDNPTVTHNGVLNMDTLTGTPNKPDVFVFDVGAEIARGFSVGFGEPEHTHVTQINGFEAGLDTIAFVNIPSSQFPMTAEFDAVVSGLGNPAIPDGEVVAFGHVDAPNAVGPIWRFIIETPDSGSIQPNISTAADYSVTLLNGQHLQLPPDPWLIV
ncbi:hypothetical protein ABIE89_007533 [Bradyrhizobium niftali]|uniref:hypothetical protein n=1 Tax=Bradyrhizobium niftali TaxID=2560055 RepID=UPI0038360716